MTKLKIFNVSVLLLLMMVSSTGNARLYKWTDENGEVHYTQTPPPKQGELEPFKKDKFPSDEEITNTLPGNWKSTFKGKVILLEFKMDGRFHQWRNARVAYNHLYSGQWSVQNRNLILYYTRADNDGGKIGEKVNYKFYDINRDYFAVKNKGGDDMTFSRSEKWQLKRKQ